MSKASIELREETPGQPVAHIRVNDQSVIGREATLQVELVAKVKDDRPVNARRSVHEQPLRLDRRELAVPLPPESLRGVYSYHGKQLDVQVALRLTIDDGVLFDSQVDSAIDLPLGDRPRIGSHDGKEIEPADAFSFLANLAAIPAHNRMITLALTVVGGLVVIANALLGLHDEMVTEAQTIFYDHTGSDGGESPLMKALTGSGVLGFSIWMAIRYQLRKYMRFALKAHPPIRRGLRLAAKDLIEGEARVDLEDVTVRVIACNRECGQYTRGSGTKKRTVSFRTPTRAVKLYEHYIALVPAGVPLGMYLAGEVDFEPMFADLYPPLEVGGSHGVEVVWEAQLIHPKFVDHEQEGSSADLRYEDFLDP